MSGVANALTLRAYLHSSYEPFSRVIPRAANLPGMERRNARISRVRARVVAGAAGVFLAALAAVAAFGRQPTAKFTHASATTGGTATQTQTYDDYGYSDDGGSSSNQTYSPSPMTTRAS